MTDESNANTYDEYEEQISIQIETRIFFRMAMKAIIPGNIFPRNNIYTL